LAPVPSLRVVDDGCIPAGGTGEPSRRKKRSSPSLSRSIR